MSNSWPMVPLKELLRPISRPVPVEPSKVYNILGAHWYAEGLYTKEIKPGREIAASNMYKVEEGDFVYNRLFAWKGSFAIATSDNDNCYVSNEFPCFIIEQNRLNSEYLRYFFSREVAWNEALGLSSGGTPTSRNRLKEELLLAMKIPLPPLDEQRRIVARVNKLMVNLQEVRKIRQASMEEVGALSQHSFKQLNVELNQRYPLSEACLQITDGEHATPPRSPLGIPLATAKNVRDGYLDMANTDFVDEGTAEKCWRRCKPSNDDILIVCVGATTGRVCRIVSPPKMVIVRSVALLRPNTGIIHPRYLEHVLKTRDIQNQIWASVKQAAQPCLYLNRLGSIRIPIPDLMKQMRVVAYLDILDEKNRTLNNLQSTTNYEIMALMPSILDKAFKGEL